MNRSMTGLEFLVSLLLVAFVVLKLTDVIGWSWWWVLLPLWGPMFFLIVVVLVAFVFVLAGAVYDELKRRNKK